MLTVAQVYVFNSQLPAPLSTLVVRESAGNSNQPPWEFWAQNPGRGGHHWAAADLGYSILLFCFLGNCKSGFYVESLVFLNAGPVLGVLFLFLFFVFLNNNNNQKKTAFGWIKRVCGCQFAASAFHAAHFDGDLLLAAHRCLLRNPLPVDVLSISMFTYSCRSVCLELGLAPNKTLRF